MWLVASVVDWFRAQGASIPSVSVWLFGLALLVSSAGFYRRVYFVSLGYAFSIAGMAVWCAIGCGAHATLWAWVHLALLGLYGVRLGSYLLHRERATSYAQDREVHYQQKRQGQRWLDVLIWLAVSLLYVLMFLPGLLHLLTPPMFGAGTTLFVRVVGVLVATGGLVMESLADKQKSDFKKSHPKRFCDTGLYRLVRCPNYLGEILFWTGSFVLAIPFYTSALRWFLCIVGYVCIVLIMMGSTKRLEHSQGERYGEDPAYQAYIRTTPVLFPFVPIYSLQGVRVYLE
ncbi:DUF1295 domain-containing protein [Myxococcota bacterium]|nr:DUF1295 domain-containing protein [Myxococcota bacterium]